jgi:PAS domain S-box-containing protein
MRLLRTKQYFVCNSRYCIQINKVMGHPLLCWDIVKEGMNRRTEFAHDIQSLQYLLDKNKWASPMQSIDSSIIWENKTIVVTDTDLNILVATKNMYQMNGYNPAEVIGKHPKMFQGKETSMQSRQQIKIAIEQKTNFNCNILNYKKDGSLYTCHIEGYPVFNSMGQLVNFIAFENAA